MMTSCFNSLKWSSLCMRGVRFSSVSRSCSIILDIWSTSADRLWSRDRSSETIDLSSSTRIGRTVKIGFNFNELVELVSGFSFDGDGSEEPVWGFWFESVNLLDPFLFVLIGDFWLVLLDDFWGDASTWFCCCDWRALLATLIGKAQKLSSKICTVFLKLGLFPVVFWSFSWSRTELPMIICPGVIWTFLSSSGRGSATKSRKKI